MAMENRVLEVRTYRIAMGKREEFHAIFRDGAVPMLRRHGITVVGYGPAVQDDDHYYLMRAYPSLERRQEMLDGFYASNEWLQNYEDTVMPMIESYHTVVVPASEEAITPLMRSLTTPQPDEPTRPLHSAEGR
jgi:NIPSNAP